MSELNTSATVQAHPYGGVLPTDLFPGTILHDQDTGNVALLTQGPGAGPNPITIPLAGPASGGVPVIYTITGAGPQGIPDDATIVYADPAGGAQQLVLPTSASRTTHLPLTIELIGTGSSEIQSDPADVLFMGSVVFALRGVGSAVAVQPGTLEWRKTWQNAPPEQFLVYVDATTGDDTNPGTFALPLLTLEEGRRRATATGGQQSATIELAASSAYTLDGGFNPSGVGPSSVPLTIRGTMALGAVYTVTSFTPGDDRTPATVTDLAAVFGVSGLRDAVIEFKTGALAAQKFGVWDNGVDTLTLLSFSDLAGLAPGDTFSVSLQATTISAPFLLFLPGNGTGVVFDRVYLDATFMLAFGCLIALRETAVRTQAMQLSAGAMLQGAGGGAYTFTISRDGAGPGGAQVNPGICNCQDAGLRNIDLTLLQGSHFDALSLQIGGPDSGVFADGGASFSIRRLSSVEPMTLVGGQPFLYASGGSGQVLNGRVDNVTGGLVVSADRGGAMVVTGLQGTGNDAPCVRARSGSVVIVTDPDIAVTGTLITGGLTPAQAGNNAPCTWTDIATGNAAFCTDAGVLARVGV